MRRSMAVLGLAGLALTACGGGGGVRLTTAAFTTQADAVCTKSSDDLGKAIQEGFDGTDAASVRRFAEQQAFPIVEERFRALDELRPPEDLQKKVDAWLSESRHALDEVKKKGEDLASAGTEPFRMANTMAAELGLAACAES